MIYSPLLILHGTNFKQEGKYYSEAYGEKVAVGITAGPRIDPAEKPDGNEDSLGIFERDDGIRVYLIADGNRGAKAADLAVEVFPKILSEIDNFPNEGTLRKAIVDLDLLIREKTKSRTTILGVLQQEDQCRYVSVGDSLLFTLESRKIMHLNKFEGVRPYGPMYLGEVYGNINRLQDNAIQTGQFTIKDGYVLTSDGFHNAGLREEAFEGYFCKESPVKSVESLLTALNIYGKERISDNGSIIVVTK